MNTVLWTTIRFIFSRPMHKLPKNCKHCLLFVLVLSFYTVIVIPVDLVRETEFINCNIIKLIFRGPHFFCTQPTTTTAKTETEKESRRELTQLKTIFNFCFISFSLEWTSTKDAMEVNISEYKVYKMRTKTEAKSRLSKHSIACICVNNAFKKSDCFRFSHSHRHFYLHTFLCTFSTKFK